MIPAAPADKMKALITCSEAYKNDQDGMETLWEAINRKVYSLEPFERQLGFPPEVQEGRWVGLIMNSGRGYEGEVGVVIVIPCNICHTHA